MNKDKIESEDDCEKVGTKAIAKLFERKHDQIKRMIRKYRKEFEAFSPVLTKISKGKTKPTEEYLLNEHQIMFLGTLLRNTNTVLDFKVNVAKTLRKRSH